MIRNFVLPPISQRVSPTRKPKFPVLLSDGVTPKPAFGWIGESEVMYDGNTWRRNIHDNEGGGPTIPVKKGNHWENMGFELKRYSQDAFLDNPAGFTIMIRFTKNVDVGWNETPYIAARIASWQSPWNYWAINKNPSSSNVILEVASTFNQHTITGYTFSETDMQTLTWVADGTNWNVYIDGEFHQSFVETATMANFASGRTGSDPWFDAVIGYGKWTGDTTGEGNQNNFHAEYGYGFKYPMTAEQVRQAYKAPYSYWKPFNPSPLAIAAIAAPPAGTIMNQLQTNNLGADLFNGTLL